MKKLFALMLSFGFWLTMGSTTLAMCIWFAPSGRVFEPANNVKTLIVEDEGRQTLVVQPQWSGDATEFGLVMPFPTRPDVAEAPEAIFTELEELTNPEIFFEDAVLFNAEGLAGAPLRGGVEVIEERQVGDFTATTLNASNAEDLQAWLNNNGYELTDEKQATLDYYINGESAFFVALKVNTDAVNLEQDGSLRGELKPLQFSFRDSELSLPLRLMASDATRVDLTIYTLASQQWYIPGAEIQFARKVTANDIEAAESLETYDARSKWLVRNQVQFNPSHVEIDANLFVAGDEFIVDNGATKRVNPDLLDPRTGLIESASGELTYIDETSNLITNEQTEVSQDPDGIDSPILIGLVVILGASNLLLLNLVVKNRTPKKGKKA